MCDTCMHSRNNSWYFHEDKKSHFFFKCSPLKQAKFLTQFSEILKKLENLQKKYCVEI